MTDRVWHSPVRLKLRESFRPLKHPEQVWEKIGVKPDMTVPSDWDGCTTGIDPAVIAALRYLDK